MSRVLGKMPARSVTVGSSSTLILAANNARLYAEIINSSNEGIWLRFGEAAVLNDGAYIAPGGFSYEMGADNLFRGAVYGICASGGKVVGTLEGS